MRGTEAIQTGGDGKLEPASATHKHREKYLLVVVVALRARSSYVPRELVENLVLRVRASRTTLGFCADQESSAE